jgi:hypothetical protein
MVTRDEFALSDSLAATISVSPPGIEANILVFLSIFTNLLINKPFNTLMIISKTVVNKKGNTYGPTEIKVCFVKDRPKEIPKMINDPFFNRFGCRSIL